jgi:hypothetical protein
MEEQVGGKVEWEDEKAGAADSGLEASARRQSRAEY